MLNNRLLQASSSSLPIIYVGGKTAGGSLPGTGGPSISLTSLTGGIASSASQDDLVIIYFGVGSNGGNLGLTVGSPVAWSEVTELFADDTQDANLVVAYKFMGSTPDTSVSVESNPTSSAYSYVAGIQVWRNVDKVNPFNVTATTATGINTVLCDPPSITPTTQGVYIVSGGYGSHLDGIRTYSSSDLTGFMTRGADDTNDCSIGLGYYEWTSGTFDPAAFTFSGTDATTYSWAAVTLALNPA